MTDNATERLTHKVRDMLDMQDAMNSKVHPEWFNQNFQWYRAIWVECAEMLDHYGWKWWKHQQPDLEQVRLELVDIFHFGMSLRIMRNQDLDELAEDIAVELQKPVSANDFKETLEILASSALTAKRFDVSAFAGCMKQCDMTPDTLYRSYVGKNTLNFFRQDHGYKEGTYIKVWDGREDNEYLVDIIESLDSDAADFQEQVYQGLAKHYPA